MSRLSSVLMIGVERADELARVLEREPPAVELRDGSIALPKTEPKPLVAASWSACARRVDDVPEPGFLGWELAEGGQPLEVTLAAMAFGKELKASGVDLLLGPSLALGSDPSTCFGPRPDVVGRAAGLFVAGLATAGVVACPGTFDGVWTGTDDPADDALPFGALASKGAVAFEARAAGPSVERLRELTGFEGVLVTPPRREADGDLGPWVVRCLERGFDWIRVPAAGLDDRVLEEVERGIEERGLGGRLERASERVAALCDKI